MGLISFNVNVMSDKNATKTHPDGGYNFTCVTSEENAEILSLLKSAAEYPADQRGIALAFYSESAIYKPRYIINQIIIEYAEQSGTPLDTVAEFIAFSRKSSNFRTKALEVFESVPKTLCFPPTPYGNDTAMYSWSRLYLIAAEIYEKEYQFEKALNAIKKCSKYNWNKTVCIERYAEILTKIDIKQAVEYLQNTIDKDSQLLPILSRQLEEYRAKAAKGYKFKPRKKTTENCSEAEMEQQIKQLAFRYLKSE